MKPIRLVPALLLAATAALHLGCDSEDTRLPDKIYEEARQLNVSGKGAEARALMKQLIAAYPGTPAAEQARKDLFLIEAMNDRDVADRQKVLRVSMKRIVDALTRYKEKRGEYPDRLEELVPEYLDRVPLAPWDHPFLYRAYVSQPMEMVLPKRGPAFQRFNTRRDAYYLASLGTDAAPGGDKLAGDILVKNGESILEKQFDPLPGPQPVR